MLGVPLVFLLAGLIGWSMKDAPIVVAILVGGGAAVLTIAFLGK